MNPPRILLRPLISIGPVSGLRPSPAERKKPQKQLYSSKHNHVKIMMILNNIFVID